MRLPLFTCDAKGCPNRLRGKHNMMLSNIPTPAASRGWQMVEVEGCRLYYCAEHRQS